VGGALGALQGRIDAFAGDLSASIANNCQLAAAPRGEPE